MSLANGVEKESIYVFDGGRAQKKQRAVRAATGLAVVLFVYVVWVLFL